VREGFLHIARKHPQRVKLIDANRSEEEIAAEIRSDCEAWLEASQ